VAYAIGKAEPVRLYVEMFGTGAASDERIQEAVARVFDLRPAAVIRDLDLRCPVFAQTSSYGHIGRELPDFTCEHTDGADQLEEAVLGWAWIHRVVSTASASSRRLSHLVTSSGTSPAIIIDTEDADP
jgi:hypothetical protein